MKRIPTAALLLLLATNALAQQPTITCTVTIPPAAQERGLRSVWHDYYADGEGHTSRVQIAPPEEWASCKPDSDRVVFCQRNTLGMTEWTVTVPMRQDGRYHFNADDIFGQQFSFISDCKGGSL